MITPTASFASLATKTVLFSIPHSSPSQLTQPHDRSASTALYPRGLKKVRRLSPYPGLDAFPFVIRSRELGVQE